MAAVEGLKAINAVVTQTITTSAALLAFTVTFAEKFKAEGAMFSLPWPLLGSWFAFAATIVFAFFTLLAVAGNIVNVETKPGAIINMNAITKIGGWMVGAFGLGIVLLIAAGAMTAI